MFSSCFRNFSHCNVLYKPVVGSGYDNKIRIRTISESACWPAADGGSSRLHQSPHCRGCRHTHWTWIQQDYSYTLHAEYSWTRYPTAISFSILLLWSSSLVYCTDIYFLCFQFLWTKASLPEGSALEDLGPMRHDGDSVERGLPRHGEKWDSKKPKGFWLSSNLAYTTSIFEYVYCSV